MEYPSKLVDFIDNLQQAQFGSTVFNPWAHYDKDNDINRRAPETRTENLARAVGERLGVAKYAMFGEALGYQGGHFLGYAMTCERQMLRHLAHRNLHPEDVFLGDFERTSKPSIRPKGFNEPTATAVWGRLKASGISTREAVFWNAFAFHPMKNGYLTNRRPTSEELHQGLPLLEQFLDLVPGIIVIPMGRVAEDTLRKLGVQTEDYVRHPAFGGVTEFRSGMNRYWPCA